MPTKSTKLGPFKGGLNNVGEVSTIDDSQLSILENFDIDTDGSLVSRPPIVPESNGPASDGSGNLLPVRGLGYYVRNDGETFLVATCNGATWIYQLSTKVWTQIWTGLASSFVQYDNKIVITCATGPGGRWEAGTFTASTGTNAMPALDQIVVYGERFWGFGPKNTAGSTTVYFSNLTVISPAQSIYDWQPTQNFFTVGKGDGQWITAIVSDPNALLIFRNGSTYQFTYPSSPIQGTLRQLNSVIGADNKWSVAKYENYYLILNNGFLYQFINYLYYPRNEKIVRFERSPLGAAIDQATEVTIIGQRAIVYYYGSIYVYNITQGVWSSWTSTINPKRFLQIPATSVLGDTRQALVLTGILAAGAGQVMMRITDAVYAAVTPEPMICRMRTKAYYFDDPGLYKRMMYWSVQFKSASGMVGVASPLDINTGSTTWDEMAMKTWDDIAKGTWDNPLVMMQSITDTIPFPTLAPVVAVAKVDAPIRFKTVYFDVSLQADGTAATSPARVFSLSAFMKEHSRAREKVS